MPTSAIFSISQPKNALTAEPFLTCNDSKGEATESIFSLHYAIMCRSGTQIKLPHRLPMSQVGLVDDHILHQPCVESLSFKSRLALQMPAHWAPSLWPIVAIPRERSICLEIQSLPVTSRYTRTQKHAYNMIVHMFLSLH